MNNRSPFQQYEFIDDLLKRVKQIEKSIPILLVSYETAKILHESIDISKLYEVVRGEFSSIEPIISIVVSVFAFGLTQVADHSLKQTLSKIGSEEIADPDKITSEQQDGFSYIKVNSAKSIETLTDLAQEAFPLKTISYAKDREARRRAFKTWIDFNPETARIILKNQTNDADPEPIGMSLLLRVSKVAYIKYRRGELRSWEIKARDLVKINDQSTPYLFAQYIYCKKGYNSSQYMCQQFLEHILQFWEESGELPVLIAPRKTKMGQVNAEKLGFERCSKDQDFPLYELDLRRVDELNEKAEELYNALYLLKVASEEIATPNVFSFDKLTNFSYQYVQDNEAIQQLTDLAEYAFPRSSVSYAEDRETRSQAFKIWTEFNPETARIIKDGEDLIGMSLMLRISEDSYNKYKSGESRSWKFGRDNIVKINEQKTPYLFVQYIYCKKGYNSGEYMCWNFLDHLSRFWKESGSAPVLIAPRKTTMGKVNAEKLGFKQVSKDEDFPLYELDLRHPDELNREGQEVYRVLQQLINTQD